MKITTTVTVHVSPDNLPLMALIVAKNGGTREGETLAQAIARIRDAAAFDDAFRQIAPHLDSYFGEKESGTSAALKELLRNGAIEVSTVVDEG